MLDPLVTLTTDFGAGSSYVAALKGVLLGVNPQARLIDLSHDIAPQAVRQAGYFLADAVPFFPAGTLHVVVVDPGVGGERALLYAEAGGQRLLAPDNGCLTALFTRHPPGVVRVLTERRFWRPSVSATFHGRDILAPVAGHLSRGLGPAELGPEAHRWVRLDLRVPRRDGSALVGEVLYADHFGNLITNIPGDELPQPPREIHVGGRPLQDWRWVQSYVEAPPGSLVVLVSSSGTLELAVVNGSAAGRLKIGEGTEVRVE